jgi:ribosomal protein S18 acetylase RimI-like enzyme
MIVRPATLADLNACLVLEHGTLTDHVWQMKVDHVWPMKVDEVEAQVTVAFQTVRLPRRMRVDYPRSLDQLTENWQQGEGFLVAEVDNEVRGYVDVLAQPWHRTAWVANMAVDREHRRQGLGTALMRHARQWVQSQGLNAILVEATTKNYPALCFYRKLGFEFCGFNDHYYANQDIALFFVHTLR